MGKNKTPYKIAFVEPDIGSRYEYMSLGLAYLSSYIKKFGNNNYETKIIISNEDVNKLLAFEPDLIAITAMTHSIYLAERIAKSIKKENSDIIVVLGGQHITAAPWSLPSIFDFAVMGEGEVAFMQLVDSIIANGKSNFENLGSILYWKDGEVIETPRLDLIAPIDSIPLPDRAIFDDLEHIISTSNFGRFNRTGIRWMQLTTARGCPYNCKFCQPSVTWKNFRMHSAEYVADEIEFIHNEYGIDAIQVEDDLFTGSKKRLRSLVELLRKKGLLGKIVYNVAARAEQIDEEWVEIFKELGIIKVEFGIEAGTDRIARYWKGGTATTEINKRAIELLNNANIGVFASFIAGAPDETLEELKETLKLMFALSKQHKYNSCSIGLATPLPGTQLWDYAVSKGIIIPEQINWDKLSTLAGLPDDTSQLVCVSQNIDVETIIKHIKQINRKMYLGTPTDFIKAVPRRATKVIERIVSKVIKYMTNKKNRKKE